MADVLLVKRLRFWNENDPPLMGNGERRGDLGREYKFVKHRGYEPSCMVDEKDAEEFLKHQRSFLGTMLKVYRLAGDTW